MRRAKRPVEWFRKVWSFPRRVMVRAALYAIVGTLGIGLALPSVSKGELWMLVMWVAGPLLVMIFAGLNDVGELPPEQRDNELARSAISPDWTLGLGFGALFLITVVAGVRDISELESYGIFYALLPTFVVLFASIAGALLVNPLRRVRAVELGVDEAGVRVMHRGASTYWPFQLLRDARIQVRGLTPRLVLRDRTGRAVVELPLLGESAHSHGRRLCEEVQAGVSAAKPLDEPLDTLRRGERSMKDWLEDSRRLLSGAQGNYRARIGEEQLLATLDDAAAPVEARAAAAHALLSAGTPRAREEAEKRIGPASPPLLQVAVRLAPASREAVSDADLEEALAALDSLDHAEAAELLAKHQA